MPLLADMVVMRFQRRSTGDRYRFRVAGGWFRRQPRPHHRLSGGAWSESAELAEEAREVREAIGGANGAI